MTSRPPPNGHAWNVAIGRVLQIAGLMVFVAMLLSAWRP